MSRQLIYHKCSNCKKLVYAYCYDCNLALFDYKELESGKGYSMQRASVHKKSKVAEDLELAIRSYLEHFCRIGGDYRLAMGNIQEYTSSAWDSAYYKTHGLRTATIKDVVHPSDANQIRNNRTAAEQFTHTQGGFNR